MPTCNIHTYNEFSILMEFRGQPLEDAYANVQHWYGYASKHWMHLLMDMIPAYESLLFICKSPEHSNYLLNTLSENIDHSEMVSDIMAIEPVKIPVCYDKSLGNDLDIMSKQLHIHADKIIQIHKANIYHVYMLGFLPGFAYMGAVDRQIATPRKRKPVGTKAGAVGIAGLQTGIYPVDSPGGWHIVGYTPLKMFDVSRAIPSLLQPGAKVQFEEIVADTYFTMQKIEIESN